MNSREVLKRLKADGWEVVAQKGSHMQLKHPVKKGRVTVPHDSVVFSWTRFAERHAEKH